MRTALYARVATDEQASKATPVQDQLQECRAYALARGWTVALEESDDGISGSVWPRAGLARILAAALRGEVDTVLMWDWSRLAREDDATSPGLAGHLRYLFQHDAKASLVTVTGGDQPPIVRDIMLAVAADQRRTGAAASRRGITSRVARRERMGGPALHGYRWTSDTTVEVVPDEAAVVALAYQLADPEAAPHLSLNEIARRIARDRAVLRYWLRNPFYAGAYFHRRFVSVRCEANPRRHWAHRLPIPATLDWGHHEPIVAPDLWHRVQERLDRHAARHTGEHPGRETLALSGLLHCGVCGARLSRRYVRSLAGGHRRTVYRCAGGCPGRYSLDDGAQQVGGLLVEALAGADVARRLAEAHVGAGERAEAGLAALRAEAARQSRIVVQLEAAVASDLIPDPTGLLTRLAAAQRARSAAQEELRRAIEARRDRSDGPTPDALSAWISRLSAAVAQAVGSRDLEAGLRPLMRSLVERVELWPESRRLRIALSERGLLGRNQSGIQWWGCPQSVAIECEAVRVGRLHRVTPCRDE